MTFEEYEHEHLFALTECAKKLVRMGWNARGEYGEQAEELATACAYCGGADHIADDRKMVQGDVSTAGKVILLEGKTYERAIVVAFESDDDLRAAIAAGQCRFTVFGGEV